MSVTRLYCWCTVWNRQYRTSLRIRDTVHRVVLRVRDSWSMPISIYTVGQYTYRPTDSSDCVSAYVKDRVSDLDISNKCTDHAYRDYHAWQWCLYRCMHACRRLYYRPINQCFKAEIGLRVFAVSSEVSSTLASHNEIMHTVDVIFTQGLCLKCINKCLFNFRNATLRWSTGWNPSTK